MRLLATAPAKRPHEHPWPSDSGPPPRSSFPRRRPTRDLLVPEVEVGLRQTAGTLRRRRIPQKPALVETPRRDAKRVLRAHEEVERFGRGLQPARRQLRRSRVHLACPRFHTCVSRGGCSRCKAPSRRRSSRRRRRTCRHALSTARRRSCRRALSPPGCPSLSPPPPHTRPHNEVSRRSRGVTPQERNLGAHGSRASPGSCIGLGHPAASGRIGGATA